MQRKMLFIGLFLIFSFSAKAQYPLDEQIINEAGAMAATGQGIEKYIDKPAPNETKAIYKNINKETCLTNINLCANEAKERERGY